MNRRMNRTIGQLVCIALTTAAVFSARPAHAETKEELVKFVDDAIAYVKANGKEKAFEAFNDPKNPLFHKGELYVYVYDYEGKCLAHGLKPELIGKPSMKIQDKKGNYVTKGLVEAAKSKTGFYEFYWPHPKAGDVQRKLSYSKDVDGTYFLGSGIYMGK